MADQIVSWGGFNSKGTSGLGITGSLSVIGSNGATASFGGDQNNSGTSTINIYGTNGSTRAGFISATAVGSFQNNITNLGMSWFDGSSTIFTDNYISFNARKTIINFANLTDNPLIYSSTNNTNTSLQFTNGTINSKGAAIFAIAGGSFATTTRLDFAISNAQNPVVTTSDVAMSLFNSKNVAIGTTTDSARLTVRGSGTTSSTTALLVQDSSGNSSFQIKDDRSAFIYGPLTLARGNNAFIYATATDYIALPRQGGPAPGYLSNSTIDDGWAITSPAGEYFRVRESGLGNPNGGITYQEYSGYGYGRNTFKIHFTGSFATTTLVLKGSRPVAYAAGLNLLIAGGNSGDYDGVDARGSAGTVTVEGGSATSSSFTTHIAGAGVNIQTGLGLGTGSAADLTFSTSTTSSVASTYHTLTQRMIIKGHTGNVGIGTGTPNYTLDVSGSSEFVGNMLITGSVIISGSATTGEGGYNTVPSTLYVKNSIAVFTDLDNTASINLKGSSTNRGLKGIYFYHNNRTAWIESVPAGASDLGGLRFGAGGNTVLDFGALGYTAGFNVPVTATSYGGSAVNSGTHYYNFNSSEFAVRIASTRLGSSGRGDLKFQLKVAGGDASDSDTFFYVPGTNKNISVNSATTDLGATLGVRGSGTTSSTTSFLVQNANASASFSIKDDGSVGIGTASPFSSGLTVANPAYGGYGRMYMNANNTLIISDNSTGGNITFGPSNRIFINTPQLAITNGYISIGSGVVITANSYPYGSTFTLNNYFANNVGVSTGLTISSNYVRNGAGGPNTGTAVRITDTNINTSAGVANAITMLAIDPSVNTTGGATTLRGIYYNPAMTSSVGLTQHTAIETTTGSVIFNGGNVGIGTSTPSSSLHISGASAVLTLTPQTPLPSGVPTGSFAVSSSVPPKPYFYDGTVWNALY